jgi:hypothetical protein
MLAVMGCSRLPDPPARMIPLRLIEVSNQPCLAMRA